MNISPALIIPPIKLIRLRSLSVGTFVFYVPPKTKPSHWGVENGLYWEHDVVFGEDLSQLRKDNSAVNMNIIRKLVINI